MNLLQPLRNLFRKAGVTTLPSSFWDPWIQEPWSGAWQHNQEIRNDTVLANTTVFACVTLVADDIAKMRLRLMQRGDRTILTEVVSNSPFLPTLSKPNDYQIAIQFIQSWMISKLIHGNTYVFKSRDNRNVVNGLYILDPYAVKILTAPDGALYYQLRRDELSGQYQEEITVPASEIIHDRMNCLFDKRVGISPLFATRKVAQQALEIISYSQAFFGNAARPSGMLTAPAHIPQATADRLKAYWEQNFSKQASGRVAVLGDGLKWESLAQNAVDSELIAQLRLSSENICSAYRVPPYKIGLPSAASLYSGNLSSLNTEYYQQLQIHIASIEQLLTLGLELPANYVVKFDEKELLRMDPATQTDALAKAVGASIMATDEAREVLNLPEVPEGAGKVPMSQQQYWPLTALANRKAPEPPAVVAPQPSANDNVPSAAAIGAAVRKGLAKYVNQ